MTLTEAFSDLPDPRTGPAQRHDLQEMLVMALCAVLCGADSWVDVAEWAEDNEAWHALARHLRAGVPHARCGGSASAPGLAAWWAPWTGRWPSTARRCAAPGTGTTPPCTWSAYATTSGLCLGQESTHGKGNEIAAIKALLDTLTLEGCIVTIDAIGCQTDIAQKILDRGGDYLLAVKDNQGKLADALTEFFTEGESAGFGRLPVSRHTTVGKAHGRIENRRALWVTHLSWLDKEIHQHWPKLAGVGMIERQRAIDGKLSSERAFYIGSKAVTTAESFAKAARSHWVVENSLHWVLDVTFHEDECRVRKDHAPQNFSALRKFALALLRTDNRYPKRSLRSRRKTADRLPEYRASLLSLTPRR